MSEVMVIVVGLVVVLGEIEVREWVMNCSR